jgi:hypothetical protein
MDATERDDVDVTPQPQHLFVLIWPAPIMAAQRAGGIDDPELAAGEMGEHLEIHACPHEPAR